MDSSVSILGINEFLWGAFKKVVLADNIAPYVDEILEILSSMDQIFFFRISLVFVQIYFDFSGYSHMAIGSARILGIKLTKTLINHTLLNQLGSFGEVAYNTFTMV